jgi:hypothetical protein
VSHNIGAVRFEDGAIRYYEYDGTSDWPLSRLHVERVGVEDNWRGDNCRLCTCGKDEPVEIVSTYGFGFHWQGRACRSCEAITAGFEPYDSEGYSRGHPSWSPWKEEAC